MKSQIIPKEFYELVEVENQYDENHNSVNTDIMVTFRITDSCNIKCEYCHWNDGIHYSFEDITKSLDTLFIYFKEMKFTKVLFYFHGGEPTTHPKLFEIIDYIRALEGDVKAYIELQTNLVMSTDKLDSVLDAVDFFDITYHYVELQKKNKHKNFIENFDHIREIKATITNMDVMLEDVPDDECDYFYATILNLISYERINNSEMIYGFWRYDGNVQTKPKHLDFYNKHNITEQKYNIDGVLYNTNDLFQQGLDCRGWKCGGGIESLSINGDGNVFSCGIHMTDYALDPTKEKVYTNLITDKSAVTKLKIWHRIGTTCRWDYCGGDFYLFKRKP